MFMGFKIAPINQFFLRGKSNEEVIINAKYENGGGINFMKDEFLFSIHNFQLMSVENQELGERGYIKLKIIHTTTSDEANKTLTTNIKGADVIINLTYITEVNNEE